ncbi:MAG: LPXTG cell wall anchor domain-containing protein [Pseudolysinimonas sp.]|uniref:LPXTG cell wall anchor domain-containing protein n=1 Tax=Pseudolysinimonas sp. TaxID=2680009 RepID=UPI0032648F18
MSSFRTRLLAVVTTLAVVGLTSLGAASAATAGPEAPALTATPQDATPGIWDPIDIDLTLTGVDASCLEDSENIDAMTVSYTAWGYTTGDDYHTGSPTSGTLPAFDPSLVQTQSFGAVGNGYSIHAEYTVSSPCFESDLTAQTDVGTDFVQSYVYGQTLTWDGTDSWWTGTQTEGVVVDLMEVSAGENGTPVATDTTDADGAYSLNAPFTSDADIARTYKIRFTFPDGGPVVYWLAGQQPSESSPGAWGDGGDSGPATWANTAYSGVRYAGGSEDPPTDPTGEEVSGTVYAQNTLRGLTADDYDLAEGATVDVMIYNGSDTVYDTDTTDASGAYSVVVPTSDWNATVLRVTLLDASVWYYRADAGPVTPSPAQRWGGTLLSGTESPTTGYDVYAGRAMSPTDLDTLCNANEDYATATIAWDGVCEASGGIVDAATIGQNRGDAFDNYGYVEFTAPGFTPDGRKGANLFADQLVYVATGDSHSVSDTADGRRYTFTDDDAWVFDDAGDLVNVDVTVDRLFSGSWVTWNISVFAHGTSTLLTDVPYYFYGELGSDNDTRWHGTGSVLLSDDGESASDPMVGHILVSGGTWSHGDDSDDWIAASLSGAAEIVVVLFDYCDTQPVADAQAILADWESSYGDDLDMLGVCSGPWSIAAPDLTVGVPFDQTYTVAREDWDWNYGGTAQLMGLPDGLQYEILDEWASDTAQSIRIFGTPTTAGAYTFSVHVEVYVNSYDFDVTGTVAPATESTDPENLSLNLDIDLGDPVEGATVTATASGLGDGAGFSIVVHSTPQTLATGSVPAGGVLTSTATLPTLEAGWHTLTFASTWASGNAAAAKLWFQVSSTGTLLAISRVDPSLANTGQDVSGSLFLGSVCLLAGLALVALRRRSAVRAR